MFWGKKNDNNNSAPPSSGPTGDGFSPEKAKKFFDHAQTVQQTGNAEYAMQLWLGGLRFDPKNMDGITSFFGCAAQFLSDDVKGKGPGKDLVSSVGGKGDIDKYLRSMLEWAMKPTESNLAVRAMESASSLRLKEPTIWIGDRALGRVLQDKKVRKELLLKIAEAFKTVEDPDRAIQAAEAAVKLDPSDGELAAYVRNLAAQATMNRGGYEKTGQEGGFRANIRDTSKQQNLEEADRIVKTEDTIERLLKVAEDEYLKRPNDLPTIENLGKRLLDRGKPTDESRAYELYMETYSKTNQFRFRELAGDIKIRQSYRKIRELQKMLEGSPGSEMLTNMLAAANEDHTKLEAEEFRLRVDAYPTDLGRKFELGKRYYQLGRNDEAITLFQESQIDAKYRVQSLNYQGQAFFRINYYDEAEATFRAALEVTDMTPETNLELRYNLMNALLEVGKSTRSPDKLREADKLASSISMKQFNYKDIRTKRDEIKSKIAEFGG
ncbi:MAG: tetratricopeptide repeat protein [Phycisphaerales bacterium]